LTKVNNPIIIAYYTTITIGYIG